MIHPSTEVRLVNEHIGYGVFARERIPKGTITWVRCALDRVFTPAEVEALGPSYWPIIDRYAYRDGRDRYILNWDHAKFMNHSCEPTVLCPGFDFDVALRDLEPGDELTYDYAVLNLDEVLECTCGRPSCRGTSSPPRCTCWRTSSSPCGRSWRTPRRSSRPPAGRSPYRASACTSPASPNGPSRGAPPDSDRGVPDHAPRTIAPSLPAPAKIRSVNDPH